MNSDKNAEALEVEVSFHGEDFILTVLWETDPDTPDEERARAADEWFLDTYGFSPGEHADDVTVQPLPEEPAG